MLLLYLSILFFSRIDGSQSKNISRFINDEWRSPNLKVVQVIVKNKPVPVFIALRDICPGEEICYNYGNGKYPWRKKGKVEL